MRTIILITMIASFINTGCTQDILIDMSERLSSYQLEKELRSSGKDSYHDIRIELIKSGKLDAFEKSDTLFILESYDIESATFYGEIWSSQANQVYAYSQGSFYFDEESVFTDYTKKLIQEWDTKAIRQEEKNNSKMTNPLQIYGSRIVRFKNEFKIDCLAFKEFFLLERDR